MISLRRNYDLQVKIHSKQAQHIQLGFTSETRWKTWLLDVVNFDKYIYIRWLRQGLDEVIKTKSFRAINNTQQLCNFDP